MKRNLSLDRRTFLTRASAAGCALYLGGCDRLSQSPTFRELLDQAEDVTMTVQRFVLTSRSLAREFPEKDISPIFKANGSTNVDDPVYQKSAGEKFANWKLVVDGLVERPAELSLDDLHGLPARSQITRHDCVEGWSFIGKWTGTQLSAVLQKVGLKPNARYLVFHCADMLERGSPYYESIDLIDAFHPQTILAYDMNGAPLAIPHGAPLRLRVERQLGYKHAKYVMRIEAVDSFAFLAGGNGGFWEDRGYEWYAGI